MQPAPAAPTRKTVTVLFADLAGSTTFEEKVDAETAREVLGAVPHSAGPDRSTPPSRSDEVHGDGFMAVWGVPEISADDADHAVDAAVELRSASSTLAAEVANTRGKSGVACRGEHPAKWSSAPLMPTGRRCPQRRRAAGIPAPMVRWWWVRKRAVHSWLVPLRAAESGSGERPGRAGRGLPVGWAPFRAGPTPSRSSAEPTNSGASPRF